MIFTIMIFWHYQCIIEILNWYSIFPIRQKTKRVRWIWFASYPLVGLEISRNLTNKRGYFSDVNLDSLCRMWCPIFSIWFQFLKLIMVNGIRRYQDKVLAQCITPSKKVSPEWIVISNSKSLSYGYEWLHPLKFDISDSSENLSLKSLRIFLFLYSASL